MAAYMDFDALEVLNEGDERISLADILAIRDSCLTELELWAVCKECCDGLQSIHSSSEMFQTLCITPESLAFDAAGNICFLDLSSDPEPLYIPPEYDHLGNSYKAHLYSLGMTMLYAAGYNVMNSSNNKQSKEFNKLCAEVTADNYDDRADIDSVLTQCNNMLKGKSSGKICYELAALGKLEGVHEEDRISQRSNQSEDHSYLKDGLSGNLFYSKNKSLGNGVDEPYLKPTESSPDTATGGPFSPESHLNSSSFVEPRSDISSRNGQDSSSLISSDGSLPLPASPRVTRGTVEGLIKKYTGSPEKTSPNVLKLKMTLSKSPTKDGNQGLLNLNQSLFSPKSTVLYNSVFRNREQQLFGDRVYQRRDIKHDIGNNSSTLYEENTERANSGIQDRNKGQSLQEILKALGSCLREDELWAICREGLLTLQGYRQHLPTYISLDTVVIEESGSISLTPVPSDASLQVIYLAPELQDHGVVTEKTCVFGLAATLWSAGDYGIGDHEQPQISELLEKLLTSMAEDDPAARPGFMNILQVCNSRENTSEEPSHVVCKNLLKDALNAADFGKNNELVKDCLQEDIQNTKNQILHAIKTEELRGILKPVSEMADPTPRVSDPTPHDKLMSEIKTPTKKLRRSSRPREVDVRQMFLTNPELLPGLMRVTGKYRSVINEVEAQPSIQPPSNFSPVITGNLPQQSSPQLSHSPGSGFVRIDSPGSAGSAFKPIVQEPPRIPSAFSSPATHFQPIILKQNDSDNSSKTKPEKPKPVKAVSSPSEKSEKDKNLDREVAKKMKLLKQNLIKNSVRNNFAKDIENEVSEDEGAAKKLPVSGPSQKVATNVPVSQAAFPTQTAVPQPDAPTTIQPPPPQTVPIPVQTQIPVQGQGHMSIQGQGQLPLQGQMGMPVAMPTFQMQLDPNTGFYQLIPVVTPVQGTDQTQEVQKSQLPVSQVLDISSQNQEKKVKNETAKTEEKNKPKTDSKTKTKTGLGTLNKDSSKDATKSSSKHSEKLKEQLDKTDDVKPKTKQRDSSKSRTRDSSGTRVRDKSRSRDSENKTREKSKTRETKLSSTAESIDQTQSPSKSKSESKMKPPAPVPPEKSSKNKSILKKGKPEQDDKSDRTRVTSPESEGEVKAKPRPSRKDKSTVSSESTLVGRSDIISASSHDSSVFASPEKPERKKKKEKELLKVANTVAAESTSASTPEKVSKRRKSTTESESEHEKRSKSRDRLQLHKGSSSESHEAVDVNHTDSDPTGHTGSSHPTHAQAPSPALAPSPSLSKDSGVSGLYLMRSAGEPSLMERLLNQDNKHQRLLGKVIHHIREEFAFDGYLENGVEDVAMAEYVTSLTNLKWETFCCAVKEKYCDLFWQEELLTKLYEDINGKAPVKPERTSPQTLSSKNARVLSVDEPQESFSDGGGYKGQGISAFKPVRLGNGERIQPTDHRLFRPRAMRVYTDTSDSTDTEHHYYDRGRRRFRKKNDLDKGKSSSMHNLLEDARGEAAETTNNGVVRSLSHTALDQPKSDSEMNDRPRKAHSFLSKEPGKPRLIHVRGSESESDHVDSSFNAESLYSPTTQKTSTPNEPYPRKDSFKWESDSSATSGGMRRGLLKSTSSIERRISRGLTREDSVSSVNSAHSGNATSRSGDQTSETELWEGVRSSKGGVIYYAANNEGQVKAAVKAIENELGTLTKENIETKIAEVEQQIMVEQKMRRKTQKFYMKLMEANKNNKGTPEDRNKLTKVSRQLGEMNDKLAAITCTRRHLEMLYSEQWGLDPNYMYSFAKSPSELQWGPDNPLLQFQTVRDPVTGEACQQLQAGTPEGLMAYLFARTALSNGFIHHFFYCYRYFASPRQLLDFIADRFSSAVERGDEANAVKICRRAVELLHVWIEGYYNIDFKHESGLARILYSVITEQVLPDDVEGENLLHLVDSCRHGKHTDLSYTESVNADDVEVELVHEEENAPTKWAFVKAALNMSSKPQTKKTGLVSCLDRKKRETQGDVYFPVVARKTDAFTLADYTSHTVAEQLTLMEQALFHQLHPVLFLNTRIQGIGVSLAYTGMITSSASVQRLNLDENATNNSLFVGSYTQDAVIQTLIEHAQSISYWIAAELVTCTSAKSQIALLSKFIHTAKICHDIRNFATCMAIVDGLENFIIRQLPAWRNLPSKSVAMMEELSNVKLFLKNDSMCLLQSEESRTAPTLPCVLLFLLHVQQQELGGFTLANGMFKWAKMRSIAKVIDQIRIFKDFTYPFEVNQELQDSLRVRIKEFSEHDLHALASQHETNFHKMSGNKLAGAFRKMKGKFSKD